MPNLAHANDDTIREECFATDLAMCCKLDTLTNVALAELNCYEEEGGASSRSSSHASSFSSFFRDPFAAEGVQFPSGETEADVRASMRSLNSEATVSEQSIESTLSRTVLAATRFASSPQYGLSTLDLYGRVLGKYYRSVAAGMHPAVPPMLSFQMDDDLMEL